MNKQNIKMHEATFEEGVEQILARDQRYPRDAYIFVREALGRTQETIHKERSNDPCRPQGEEKHVTGQQLLAGIREYALAEFGPMAITVFEEWGITRCRDFGEIVFNMVNSEMLKKTEHDSLADFENGYDFVEVFRKPFLPSSRRLQPSSPPEPSSRPAT